MLLFRLINTQTLEYVNTPTLMINRIKTEAERLFPEVVELRRTLHRHPELAFEEYETARLVKETLEPLGISLQTEVAKTGVVATIHGAHPGPTRALRADMDALPILEENTFDFVSTVPGKMHACGHDAHTSSLLGTAKILHALREDLHGSVRLIFQPSEERIPGGAKPMIEEGVLAATDTAPAPEIIFGQHVEPDLPAGQIGVFSGTYMASADEIFFTIHGRGGHAARPHRMSTDTILVASHLIIALQSLISRNRPPDVPSVLSIGKIIADGATNVIPDTARLEGTFRSMDDTWRFKAHDLMRRTAQHIGEAFGARIDVEVAVGYPPLYNHPKPTDFVRQAARAYVGAENTIEIDHTFVSEDFAWYTKHIPGTFYRLGIANAKQGITHGLHTPRFTIDEEALRIAPGFMAYLAWSSGHQAV